MKEVPNYNEYMAKVDTLPSDELYKVAMACLIHEIVGCTGDCQTSLMYVTLLLSSQNFRTACFEASIFMANASESLRRVREFEV